MQYNCLPCCRCGRFNLKLKLNPKTRVVIAEQRCDSTPRAPSSIPEAVDPVRSQHSFRTWDMFVLLGRDLVVGASGDTEGVTQVPTNKSE